MSKRLHLALTLAAAVSLLSTTQAGAAPIDAINGATQLNVTSFGALTGLGVTVAPGGTAQVVVVDALPSPIVFYDVTSIDLDTNEIFHEGSLLDLSTTATVRLANFIIDGDVGQVLADVTTSSAMLDDVAVFEVSKACSLADPCEGLDGTLTIEGLELELSDVAGDLLRDELDIPDLGGEVVAVANSSFTPVPEPGTALLLVGGLSGLAVVGRDRRRS